MGAWIGKSRVGPGILVLAALGVLFLLIFSVTAVRGADASTSAQAALASPAAVLSVRYETAALIGEEFPGVVAARRQSDLGFERGGRIAAILVNVGDRVTEGQPLARLDTTALAAQIAAADAQTAEARANVAFARGVQDRQAALVERGHVSRQRFDEASSAAEAADARRAAAAAGADALRAQLVLSVIAAPYDGVVTARQVDEGAIAAPGAPVLTLVEDRALEIRIGLPQSTAAGLTPGDVFSFRAASGPVEARFRATTGVVDTRTRSVAAVFDVIDPDAVSPGEIARLELQTPIAERGFWAPTSALAEGRRGLWTVYALIEEDGEWRVEPRPVETLRVEAGRAFVRGAVDDGALILESGLQRVAPGQRVRPAGVRE